MRVKKTAPITHARLLGTRGKENHTYELRLVKEYFYLVHLEQSFDRFSHFETYSKADQTKMAGKNFGHKRRATIAARNKKRGLDEERGYRPVNKVISVEVPYSRSNAVVIASGVDLGPNVKIRTGGDILDLLTGMNRHSIKLVPARVRKDDFLSRADVEAVLLTKYHTAITQFVHGRAMGASYKQQVFLGRGGEAPDFPAPRRAAGGHQRTVLDGGNSLGTSTQLYTFTNLFKPGNVTTLFRDDDRQAKRVLAQARRGYKYTPLKERRGFDEAHFMGAAYKIYVKKSVHHLRVGDPEGTTDQYQMPSAYSSRVSRVVNKARGLDNEHLWVALGVDDIFQGSTRTMQSKVVPVRTTLAANAYQARENFEVELAKAINRSTNARKVNRAKRAYIAWETAGKKIIPGHDWHGRLKELTKQHLKEEIIRNLKEGRFIR